MHKTLLLLGGSSAQVEAIDKASSFGYHTVLCDYLHDNPGRCHADSFHLVSTTDKEAVLAVAREECIDGVVAYSSDPAAPTAAYVADKLGLPGVPYATARAFCEKHLFRRWLQERGFNTPSSIAVRSVDSRAEGLVSTLRLPVIIKPADSSGSKGVTVVRDHAGITPALTEAARFSRNGMLVAEEFVERDHPYVIEAEVFVVDGEVTSWGLINSVRDEEANPLLPAGYTYPLDQSKTRKAIVRREVSRLVRESGVSCGAFNIEMVIDADDRLFFLDAGPRNGGNMLPRFISMISGKDLVGATIRAAMGDMAGVNVSLDGEEGGFWGLGVLHSACSGYFAGTCYSETAKAALVEEYVQKTPGDDVSRFERCNDLVGLSFFKFSTKDEMDSVMLDAKHSMGVILS